MTSMRLALTALVALAAPGVAQAQVGGGEPMGPNSGGVFPLRQDIRPMGFQTGRYKSGFEYTAHFEADECKTFGCIVVVNKSASVEVVQFYINDGDVDSRGVPDWGANQFQGFHLDPNRAVWTPRPRKMKCESVVRVVLRDPKTGKQSEGIERMDLCKMPKTGFAVLEIQGDSGRVILEPGTPTEQPAAPAGQ